MKDDKIKKCLIAGYDIHIISQEELNEYWNYIINLQEKCESLDKEYKNLQEELNSANESIIWWQNRFNALQEENERLKSKIDEVINKQQFIEEKFDYKSRNEKAIEYIYKLQKDDDIEIWRENGYWAYLLNILQGDDNES